MRYRIIIHQLRQTLVWNYCCYYSQGKIILVTKEQRKLDVHYRKIIHQPRQTSVCFLLYSVHRIQQYWPQGCKGNWVCVTEQSQTNYVKPRYGTIAATTHREKQYWLRRSKGNWTCITEKLYTNHARPRYAFCFTVSIGFNNIGHRGAKEIGYALQNNHILTTLNLGMAVLLLLLIGKNNIGNEGAKEIGRALQKNFALTTLDLGMSLFDCQYSQEKMRLPMKNKWLQSMQLLHALTFLNPISNEQQRQQQIHICFIYWVL
eukprot:TRINITY_DN491_c0_g2_i9.p1 TRINITY_DN491_c0_g2~~TRINITY_DN491_c0_g2_i9.p1  ORF type:complete len:261 (-),score=-34.19 TRINITY_DN491_c0_g2_i9:52-834(-)